MPDYSCTSLRSLVGLPVVIDVAACINVGAWFCIMAVRCQNVDLKRLNRTLAKDFFIDRYAKFLVL
jgi:hypothetical protein